MARHHPPYTRYLPQHPIPPRPSPLSQYLHPFLVLQPDERKELLHYVRYEFEAHKTESNLDKIRYFLAQGRRDFHAMESSIDLSVAQFEHKDEKERMQTSRRFQKPIVQLYRDETIGN
jgi:Complex 1 protein (LYR family)